MAEVHRLIKQERHLRKKKDERRGMTEGERERASAALTVMACLLPLEDLLLYWCFRIYESLHTLQGFTRLWLDLNLIST